MRALIQRVEHASVTMVDSGTRSSIGPGFLVLAGIEEADTAEDIDWLTGKLVRLRLFNGALSVIGE